ncbi:MAG: ester cyclase [Armatimonadetes bacterium]|nr:ester cyclase [Armatimonadota bacterium]
MSESHGTGHDMAQAGIEAKKERVVEFYDALINRKDFVAVSAFIGKHYRQHNPLVADGPEGLAAFVDFLKTEYPDAQAEVKRVLADGDYVVLHVHSVRVPGSLGRAITEIFRLEEGKVVEHWDTIQEILEVSANPNGMF